MPERAGNSPTINGDVSSRNNGVKATSGTVSDSADCLIAFIYKIVQIALRPPPSNNANQNALVKLGILIKNKIGSKNGSAKKRSDHAITYSSMSARPFLLKTSLSDSQRAVKRTYTIQSMIARKKLSFRRKPF